MEQLGFETLLETAAEENAARAFAAETAHLPETFEAAVPFFRQLICQHDRAMRAADVEEVMHLRDEAHLLATKLNCGDTGILAYDDAPAYRLERSYKPEEGREPLWGQAGCFVIDVCAMRIEIELNGVFGIGACFNFWPGFAARAVDYDQPFLSATGYRSFLGVQAPIEPNETPDTYVARIIESYIASELKGRLVTIDAKCKR